MQSDQNRSEDWTGSTIVLRALEVVKVVVERSPVPYDEVGNLVKRVFDSIVDGINNLETARTKQQAVSEQAAPPAPAEPAAPVAAAAKAPSKPSKASAKASGESAREDAAPAAASAAADSVSEIPALEAAAEVTEAVAETKAPEAVAAVEAPSAAGDEPMAANKRKSRKYKFAHISKKPVVPIDESVHDDYIICLIDGEKRRMMHRYVRARYGMSVEEYKEHFGLKATYPMTAPGYAQEKRIYAIQQGLGTSKIYENAKAGKEDQPTPAKVTKRKREKADTAASA